jgi:hypothetical protein
MPEHTDDTDPLPAALAALSANPAAPAPADLARRLVRALGREREEVRRLRMALRVVAATASTELSESEAREIRGSR